LGIHEQLFPYYARRYCAPSASPQGEARGSVFIVRTVEKMPCSAEARLACRVKINISDPTRTILE